MIKLLVNTPNGVQTVIEVGEGGGYFDSERVIWDERIDGPLPEITLGGMVRVDDILTFDQERMDDHEDATNVVPVPQTVTMRQARLALLGAGLLATVSTAIDALESPLKEAARIEWDYSSEVHRNRALVTMLGASLGLTEEQLDNLFILAASL